MKTIQSLLCLHTKFPIWSTVTLQLVLHKKNHSDLVTEPSTVTWCFSYEKDVRMKEIEDAGLTESIHGHGRSKNR